MHAYAAGALFDLATKANNLAPVDCAPAPPEQKLFMPDYVNNATVSDVTFLVRSVLRPLHVPVEAACRASAHCALHKAG